ncbi:MAG: HDIG domain-containing protein [Anaerolineales bacterium]|nr:HDIG domain-containing protein [Anaerolineales bacterium]
MKREDALDIVNEFVSNQNLLRHMLAVEAAMEDYAGIYGEDPEEWGILGLLHDFDWEIHPTMDSHPQDGAPILLEKGVPESIIRAILSHADHTGVPRESRMEQALFACDEITGLITAVALVRPSRSVHDVKVKSVKKKWKDQRFAANVNREDIERGAEELGVDLWEHVGRVIHSMQRIAPDLGLEGTNSSP